MGKYTMEQLGQMAATVMASREAGDERFIALIITLSFVVGMQPHDVLERIEQMAAAHAAAKQASPADSGEVPA